MIYNINGKLTYIDQNFAVVECGGIGFKCFTSLTTLKNIGKIGSNVNLFTYLSVREDAMDLYGFSTKEELDLFKLLISVSGIGPKAASAILSELPPDRLSLAIAGGDSKSITRAQGVGKKTAERVVLELKDKIGSIALNFPELDAVSSATAVGSNSSEAVEALVTLGFTQSDAALTVSSLDSSLSVDEMIRLALKKLSSNL